MIFDAILKALYFAGLAFILLLALEPHPPQIGAHWDKLNHMMAFFTLSLGARVLWRQASWQQLFVLLVALGGLIEILQGIMPFGRDAEWMDWAADTFAVVVGLAVASVMVGIARRLGLLAATTDRPAR